MAEIAVPDGSWTFNGETLRIVPGSDKDVHDLRKTLGEVVVPLEAIAGVAFEPARKGGHVRLRLRKGADPLSDAVAGSLGPPADPYRLSVPKARAGAAEYFADEIRDTLLVYQTPGGPCEDYLLPGPNVPISATAGDGTAVFDGERVRLEWTGFANTEKEKAGSQEFPLSDLTGVEWKPQSGMGYGTLRFRIKGEGPRCRRRRTRAACPGASNGTAARPPWSPRPCSPGCRATCPSCPLPCRPAPTTCTTRSCAAWPSSASCTARAC
ncbi:DUF4429 domain-containing protein [Nonomuraea sp. M3C6]|uniref:DUF4429 domain-containing protein n=1 Tax=Nonomuraea marmarensis TaxID=3351344 RepID=A0ABW7ABK2_9ACTN